MNLIKIPLVDIPGTKFDLIDRTLRFELGDARDADKTIETRREEYTRRIELINERLRLIGTLNDQKRFTRDFFSYVTVYYGGPARFFDILVNELPKGAAALLATCHNIVREDPEPIAILLQSLGFCYVLITEKTIYGMLDNPEGNEKMEAWFRTFGFHTRKYLQYDPAALPYCTWDG